MYKILLPTDGSDLSQKAIEQSVSFAKAFAAKIIGLHVVPEFHTSMRYGHYIPSNLSIKKMFEEESQARAQQVLASVEEEAKRAGLECECVTGFNDSIYEEIIRTAETQQCDLIIMASHGHAGITGLLLGSETAKVLTHTKLPVLVLR
jgi:nucleotide-binding universal stress UspA family protein